MLSKPQKIQLQNVLLDYLTENRKQSFERVLAERTNHLTLAVEDLYQEQNASAVVRTAECFGVQTVNIIEQKHQYKIARDIARGSDKWVDLNKYHQHENNALACVNDLKAKGYKIIATTPHTNSCTLDELDISEKTALFFGTEFTGISQDVIDNADGFVRIPMYGFTESFNISVAAAVCMQHLVSKLKKSDINWHLTEYELLEKRIEWATKTIPSGRKIYEHHVNQILQNA
jgi:tRNA (guanosine-2'-O-)-methyltransferase